MWSNLRGGGWQAASNDTSHLFPATCGAENGAACQPATGSRALFRGAGLQPASSLRQVGNLPHDCAARTGAQRIDLARLQPCSLSLQLETLGREKRRDNRSSARAGLLEWAGAISPPAKYHEQPANRYLRTPA